MKMFVTSGILEIAEVLLSGALIAFVYDLIRIFRRAWIHSNRWIGIEDAAFWLWTSFWSFRVLYRVNDGEIRVYIIGAMMIGMVGYYKVCSQSFVSFFGGWLKRIAEIVRIPFKKVKIYIIIFRNKLKKEWKRSIMKVKQSRQKADLGGMSDGKDDKDGT